MPRDFFGAGLLGLHELEVQATAAVQHDAHAGREEGCADQTSAATASAEYLRILRIMIAGVMGPCRDSSASLMQVL